MAQEDILFRTVNQSGAAGINQYYSIDVVDQNGVPRKSLNTTNAVEAKRFINEVKKQNPNATINGGQDNPLADTIDIQPADPAGPIISPSPNNLDKLSETTSSEQLEESPYKPPDRNPGQPDSGRIPVRPPSQTKDTRYIAGVRSTRLQDYRKLSEQQRGALGVSGVFGAKRLQPMIDRQNTACEKVIRGLDNNAFIVLGNDRVSFPHTGYGGKGHTQTDSIDIVVGMAGPHPREYVEEPADIAATDTTIDGTTPRGNIQVPIKINPNFFVDAARIYISQKTDVDKNFGIAEMKGKSNIRDAASPFNAKSAVALKADNVRLIARESLRLVTGTDKKNSQNGDISGENAGIELIANNDHTTLQPLVLGDNLAEGMKRVMFHVEKIAQSMHSYIKYQQKFNQAIANHDHVSPFFALNSLLNLDVFMKGLTLDVDVASKVEVDMLKHSHNLAAVKSKYFYDSGSKYIGSPNNKTN
tara:strand:+ start:1160 stop:2575 length:1416 start_codon:yes stop_codon:yes gene_type:complete